MPAVFLHRFTGWTGCLDVGVWIPAFAGMTALNRSYAIALGGVGGRLQGPFSSAHGELVEPSTAGTSILRQAQDEREKRASFDKLRMSGKNGYDERGNGYVVTLQSSWAGWGDDCKVLFHPLMVSLSNHQPPERASFDKLRMSGGKGYDGRGNGYVVTLQSSWAAGVALTGWAGRGRLCLLLTWANRASPSGI